VKFGDGGIAVGLLLGCSRSSLFVLYGLEVGFGVLFGGGDMSFDIF
jgi:hypothetical protein